MKDKFSPIDLNEVLYFQHLPKTAGTTLTYYLDGQFSKDEIFPYKTVLPWWKSKDFKRVVEKDEKYAVAGYRFVRGHFGYGFRHEIPGKPIYITILRNGAERCISVYGHWQNVYKQRAEKGKNFSHPIFKAGESLNSFVKDKERSEVFNNRMAYMLSVDADRRAEAKKQFGSNILDSFPKEIDLSRYRKIPIKNHYELALKHLDEFAFVGIQHYFQESLLLLAALFNWRPMMTEKRYMVHKNRLDAKDLDEKTLREIEKLNEYDQRIVDYAEKKFKSQYLDLIEKKLGKKLAWKDFLKDREKINDQLFEQLMKDHKKHLWMRPPHKALYAIINERKNRLRVSREFSQRKKLGG